MQPFFVLAQPYTLKYLRDSGFKTFGDIIDESYDNEVDDIKRFNMVIDEITKLFTQNTLDQIHDIYYSVFDILEHNFNHLMMEFYFSLHLIKKNGFIYLEKINYPKIKKMILYIKKNLDFLNIYYENYFRNIIIFKIKNYEELNNNLYTKNNKFINF